jgi:GNAT superfamily N-acetyltransferase
MVLGLAAAGWRRMGSDLSKEIPAIDVHVAETEDVDAIVALDAEITGTAKADYWMDIFERFAGTRERSKRYFLVAKSDQDQLAGFVVGEIRAWEFGSPPCGWVIALSVSPEKREQGIGTLLFDALCAEMRKDGATTIRTMVLGNDKVNLSFFRGEGLAAGPYIELERRLD